MKSRLQDLFSSQYLNEIKEELSIENVMDVPRLRKVVVNMGLKEAVGDSKAIVLAQEILSKICGQQSVKTRAKKSIAGFKLRQGMFIGVRVTLRKAEMYNFLDKFINLALPSVRDFNGVSSKFDGNGNYNIGIKDWMIFPEVDYDSVDVVRGMNLTIETSASTDAEASVLLKHLGVPFKKKNN